MDQTSYLEEPFASASGRYEFNPATLMQRRPHHREEDPFFQGASHLQHERAHWFQFCGSTIGSLYMTLSRVEDIAILSGLSTANMDSKSVKYVIDAIDKRRPLLPNPGEQRISNAVATPHLRNVAQRFSGARTIRTLLIDARRQWNWPVDSRSQLLRLMLPEADRVYAIHTGKRRDWHASLSGDIYGGIARAIQPVIANDRELTTRHLLETGAFLNEMGAAINIAWGSHPRARQRFMGFSHSDIRHTIEDAVARLSNLYSDAAVFALSKWIPDAALAEDLGTQIARLAPTIACCLDIALNPPVVPICKPTPISWDSLYPPSRYVAAVDAVAKLGTIDEWPDNSLYLQYRERVCESVGLGIGYLDHRSWQNPVFGQDYFFNVKVGDPVLNRMSYFDYVIWAMEAMHEFRAKNPLQWSMPWLASFAATDFDVIANAANAGPRFAPLCWEGHDLSGAGFVSSDLAIKLALDITLTLSLKASAVTGEADLTDYFPKSFIDEDLKAMIARALEGIGSYGLGNITVIHRGDSLPPREDDQREGARVIGQRIHRVSLPRDTIASGDFSILTREFALLRKDPLGNKRVLELEFGGYEYDSRGLWDVPDVTAYLRTYQQTFPFWSWYARVHPQPDQCPGFVLTFLAGFDNPRRISDGPLRAWLDACVRGLVEEAQRASAEPDLVRQMVEDIAKTCGAMSSVRLQ